VTASNPIWNATYNGDGAHRVVNVVGRGATTYTLDYAADSRILAEQTLTSTTLYLYGHDCLGEYTDHWLYYLPDASGYVRQGTDSQGQVTSAWTYDPDGSVLIGPQGLVSHLVCGGVYDWSTGLIFKGGRYFDPSLGIWLALTPLMVVQSWRGRKRRRRGYTWYLVVLCVVIVGGLLVACNGPRPDPTPTCTDTPTPTWTRIPGWTPTPGGTPGRTPTPVIPTPVTPSPTPTPTPWPYGQAIANAARNLLNNAGNYYVWGGGGRDTVDENYTDPPPRVPPKKGDIWWGNSKKVDLYERVGGNKTPIVCADVIDLSYEHGGLPLRRFTKWFNDPGWPAENPARSVPALRTLLNNHHQMHRWGEGTIPELGDMVLTPDLVHSGIVAEKMGNDASTIFIVNASYPNDRLDRISLALWNEKGGDTLFGHPDPNQR
jgi:hypothetical protein